LANTWLVTALLILGAAGCSVGVRDSGRTGGELFLTWCSGCHPNGGNSLYPGKNLDRMTLAANGITTPRGIVAKMRHPDPGMKEFDRQTISDADALKVAEYVLATFQ
jgi:cytochrome c6